MPYTMRTGDSNVVTNLRREYGEALAKYQDNVIAGAWYNFSLSNDYENHDNAPATFLLWVEAEQGQG